MVIVFSKTKWKKANNKHRNAEKIRKTNALLLNSKYSFDKWLLSFPNGGFKCLMLAESWALVTCWSDILYEKVL